MVQKFSFKSPRARVYKQKPLSKTLASNYNARSSLIECLHLISITVQNTFRRTGIPGHWTQVLDAGLWMLEATLWTLGSIHWTLSLTVSEQNQSTVSFLESYLSQPSSQEIF